VPIEEVESQLHPYTSDRSTICQLTMFRYGPKTKGQSEKGIKNYNLRLK
jgi:hypothetical protein